MDFAVGVVRVVAVGIVVGIAPGAVAVGRVVVEVAAVGTVVEIVADRIVAEVVAVEFGLAVGSAGTVVVPGFPHPLFSPLLHLPFSSSPRPAGRRPDLCQGNQGGGEDRSFQRGSLFRDSPWITYSPYRSHGAMV